MKRIDQGALTAAMAKLNLANITYQQMEDDRLVVTTIAGETVNYFCTTGTIKSNAYNEKGISNLIAVCQGTKELTLRITKAQKNWHNRRVASYMDMESLERKAKIEQWLYTHGIPYSSKGAIVRVTRTADMLPYESYDKRFQYNATSDYVYDSKGHKILPRGMDTLKMILQGGTDYSYVSDEEAVGIDFRTSPEYIETLKRVRARDGHRCVVCKKGDAGIHLAVHHKKAYSGFPSLRLDMDNMITVCSDCHKWLDIRDGTADYTAE